MARQKASEHARSRGVPDRAYLVVRQDTPPI
jgi:hypothetical protein